MARWQLASDWTIAGADAAQLSKSGVAFSWSSLERQDEAYCHRDFGAGYFSGDFNFRWVHTCSAGSGTNTVAFLYPFALTQGIGSQADMIAAAVDWLAVVMSETGGQQKTIRIQERYSGSSYNSSEITMDPGEDGQNYYIELDRTGSLMTLTVRNSSHSGSQEGQVTLTLTSVESYRYGQTMVSIESGTVPTQSSSGAVSHLNLDTSAQTVRDFGYGSLYGPLPDNDVEAADKTFQWGSLYGPIVLGEPTPAAGGIVVLRRRREGA